MEIVTDLLNNQLNLYIPVIVIVGAILLYTFGFKSAEQPPFDKLTAEDRKPANKKRKIKEKKANANGHISTGESKIEKSPSKESKRSPAKEVEQQKVKKAENVTKQVEKNKKNEATKAKTIEEIKNKKNLKKAANEKPVDFDDGNWETVPSKADKKKKQEQSPAKKDKKTKKVDKSGEIDKEAKEIINKELQEQYVEKEVEVEKIVEDKIPVKEEIVLEEPVIEEKKDKKKEKKARKESEKSEKSEKHVEHVTPIKESIPVKQAPVKEKEVEKIIEPEVEKGKKVEEKKPAPVKETKEGGIVFDELGDTWTEAKQPKKSKKKARRDN